MIYTIPNLVSVVRLALIPVFVWFLFGKDDPALAGWTLGIIGSTDWVDGYLARRLDQVSEVGKFLDPLADRIAVAVAVIGGWIADVLPDWFAAAIIVREVIMAAGALVIALRARAQLAVRYLGKLATFMLYAAVAWFYLGVGYDIDLILAAAWVVGIPGLIIYYVVVAQYVGDGRRLLSGTGAGE